MGQLLHGSARTTAALRRAIQHSQEGLARLAARYDLNAKTVAKWRKRTTVEDGIQFTNRLKVRWAFKHLFDRICEEHKIEHRLTKINHPWTNGQVERMNRTIKDATVKRYHYQTHEQLRNISGNFSRPITLPNG